MHDIGLDVSYGALLQLDGVTIARLAVYIGDSTNNEAEYQGVLAVLRHAVSSQRNRICRYGDSKLILSQ